MPLINLRRIIALLLLLTIATACAKESRSFAGVSSFAVTIIKLDRIGNGTVETTYVDPGDPAVHVRKLGIAGVEPNSIAVITKNGKPCGSMTARFFKNGHILSLGRGASVRSFSEATETTIQPYLVQLHKTAASQRRSAHPITVVADLLRGC